MVVFCASFDVIVGIAPAWKTHWQADSSFHYKQKLHRSYPWSRMAKMVKG